MAARDFFAGHLKRAYELSMDRHAQDVGQTMTGKIRFMIDEILRIRTANNPLFASTTKTKLILKGLDPGKFTPASPDDPIVIARVIAVAAEMGVYFK